MIEFLSATNLEEGLDFAERSHADSAWRDYPFSKDMLRANLTKMIGNDKFFTCIYRKEGAIVGYFFATLTRFLFSGLLIGSENGVYILPEHRGGRVAVCMFREYMEWCQRMNAEPFVEIYFGNDLDNEKVYSFFRKLGLIECGRAFRGGRHGLQIRPDHNN